MKKALIALTLCGAAQPALAQWGLFGFAADGEVLRIDHTTGASWNVGHIGKPVVAATSTNDREQDFFVLTEDDQLLQYHRMTGQTTLLFDLVGRPSGYEPVAMDYCFGCAGISNHVTVVLSPLFGDDVIFRVSLLRGEYEAMWSTGVDGIVALQSDRAMDVSGRIYHVDWYNQQLVLRSSSLPSSPVNSYVSGPCRATFAATNELWTEPRSSGSWQSVGGSGLSNLVGLAYANAEVYADCDPDPSGIGPLNIFDFLCFQDEFVRGTSYACDCDVSTGPGVCDIFDFLCFQNAYVIGSANGC